MRPEQKYESSYLDDSTTADDFGASIVFHQTYVPPQAAAAPPAVKHGWLWHLFHPGHKDT